MPLPTRPRIPSPAGPAAPARRHLLLALPALVLAGCAGPSAGPPPRPVPLPPPGASTPVPGSAPGPARGGTGADYDWTRDAQSAHAAFSRYLGAGAQVRRSTDDRVWVVLPGDALWADGRAALLPPAHRWLDQVALVLKAWPAAEVRLVGHTDPRGTAAANDALSLERAASARDWLVARGVAARRISVAGRGSRDAGQPGGDRRLELLVGERAR